MMPMPEISTEDGFRRRVSYLRVSLTDRCNLRCRYCMPTQGPVFIPKESLLTNEEINRILKVFVGLGVRKIRLTGGEPLLHPGVEDILAEAVALGIEDVAL